MPDWLAHVLLAYVLCSVLGTKFNHFTKENTALVMAGALIPDLVKLELGFDLFGIAVEDFLAPLHHAHRIFALGRDHSVALHGRVRYVQSNCRSSSK